MPCGGDSIIPLEMLRYSAVLRIRIVSGRGRLPRARSRLTTAKPVASAVSIGEPSRRGVGHAGRARRTVRGRADAPPSPRTTRSSSTLLDDDGRMIGTDDHAPPTPTRQWKPGSTVEYTHTDVSSRVSDYVGDATVRVGLYSTESGERLPLAGEAIEPRAVKAGSFEMRRAHRTVSRRLSGTAGTSRSRPRGSGVEWQWSTKSGRLTFRNPKRDVGPHLELDQPGNGCSGAQQVEIRMGETVVDSFDLEPGPADGAPDSAEPGPVRRRPETVELTVVVRQDVRSGQVCRSPELRPRATGGPGIPRVRRAETIGKRGLNWTIWNFAVGSAPPPARSSKASTSPTARPGCAGNSRKRACSSSPSSGGLRSPAVARAPGGSGSSRQEFLVFNQELATLLKAGMPLVQSLDILRQRVANPTFKAVLDGVHEKVKSGHGAVGRVRRARRAVSRRSTRRR